MSLTDQQKKFVRYYVETGKPTESARRAGYSTRNATKAAAHMIKDSPNVMTAIEEAKTLKGKATNYDLERAMAEAAEAYVVASEEGNASAMLAATKLKSQLMKLLDDRPVGAAFQIVFSGIDDAKTTVSIVQPSISALTGTNEPER